MRTALYEAANVMLTRAGRFSTLKRWALEVLPYPDPKLAWPVHQRALVEAGAYLIENLALEEAARQNLTTFCFILLPVKFAGATGCPVRPIAVL